MNNRTVQMIAVWDFTGPEGTPSGAGRGLVKRDAVFVTTPARSRLLMASGKARELIPIPEPKRDGPTRTTAEHPQSFRYENLTAIDVLEKVENGILTPVQALELERARESPRSTLIARLEKMTGG